MAELLEIHKSVEAAFDNSYSNDPSGSKDDSREKSHSNVVLRS